MYCDVPLSTLISSPLSLVQGSQVIVKVRAVNLLGFGSFSTESTSAVYIVALP